MKYVLKEILEPSLLILVMRNEHKNFYGVRINEVCDLIDKQEKYHLFSISIRYSR